MEETMPGVENNLLIADVARDVIAQTEPGELPLFRTISTEYFKRPAEANKKKRGKDELLGFGIGDAVALATPAMLVVMPQVVVFLTEVGTNRLLASHTGKQRRKNDVFLVSSGDGLHRRSGGWVHR